MKPTATAIAEIYNGIDLLIIDTIDLPLIPYSNIIRKVSIGSFPINNKIKEKTLDLFKKNFQNRLYIEIQRHNEFQEKNFENYLLKVSKSLKLPLIATQEVFYLNEEMYEAHDALTCIGEKTFVDDKNRFRYNNHHYFKSQDELEKLYSDHLSCDS